ncbi:MAG: hypothetical protein KKF30_12645 [Proteobacteria bacterium]|nr:hypothetical protein [Pseudomonadota bacterium]MBU4470015.1 hypothetical protein [Pseudomonadota bacterium]MCG2753796.1 hypothetical protein [Desulfobacteraceae bacterium]
MRTHHKVFSGMVITALLRVMMYAGPVLAKDTLTPEEAKRRGWFTHPLYSA